MKLKKQDGAQTGKKLFHMLRNMDCSLVTTLHYLLEETQSYFFPKDKKKKKKSNPMWDGMCREDRSGTGDKKTPTLLPCSWGARPGMLRIEGQTRGKVGRWGPEFRSHL